MKYKASYAQKRIVFDELYKSKSYSIYNTSLLLNTSHLDNSKEKILVQIQSLINKHLSLKTRFYFDGVELYQIIEENSCLYEWKEELIESCNKHLDNNILYNSFDLKRGPLIKLTWFPKQGQLEFLTHHSICDGVSKKILESEFYNVIDPILPMQYIEYSQLEYSYLSGEEGRELVSKWDQFISSCCKISSNTIPNDFIQQQTSSYGRLMQHHLLLDFKPLLRKYKISSTLFSIFSWTILLYKVFLSSECRIQLVDSNRHFPYTEHIIGQFANINLFQASISEFQFSSLINYFKSQEQVRKTFSHIPINMSTIITSSFLDQTCMISSFLEHLHYRQTLTPVIKCDLHMMLGYNSSMKPVLQSEYNPCLFLDDTIHLWLKRWDLLIQQLVSQDIQHLNELSILLPEEQSFHMSIHPSLSVMSSDVVNINLYLKQASSFSIIDQKRTYSYLEILCLIQIIHSKLLSCNIKPLDIVIVRMKRSALQVCVILTLLLYNIIYCPYHPNDPIERLMSIISQLQPSLIISETELVDLEIPSLILNPEQEHTIDKYTYKYDLENISSIDLSHIAYIVFTSGTTGSPKGVAISHKSLCTYLQSLKEGPLLQQQHYTQSYWCRCTFDVHLHEILSSLITDSTIVVLREDSDLRSIWNQICEHQVVSLYFTPSFGDILFRSAPSNANLSFIRNVSFIGETLYSRTVLSVKNLIPTCTIFNYYGPAETTLASSVYILSPESDIFSSVIPIGVPLKEYQFYILDSSLSLCSFGVEGQLYIGGTALMKEYINDVSKTNDVIFVHPSFGRLYKTGDIVKIRLNDHRIVFVKRNDTQLKINGQRFDSREIEYVIETNTEIKECLVVLTPSQELICIYRSQDSLNTECLTNCCESYLPRYMIPTRWVRHPLPFPTTLNGKLDRSSLFDYVLQNTLTQYVFEELLNEEDLQNTKVVYILDILNSIKNNEISKMYLKLSSWSLTSLDVMRVSFQIQEQYEIDVIDIISSNTILELATKMTPL